MLTGEPYAGLTGTATFPATPGRLENLKPFAHNLWLGGHAQLDSRGKGHE